MKYFFRLVFFVPAFLMGIFGISYGVIYEFIFGSKLGHNGFRWLDNAFDYIDEKCKFEQWYI